MVNTELTRGGASRMAAVLTRGLNNLDEELDVSMLHCQNQESAPPFFGIKRPLARPLNALIVRALGSTATVDLGVVNEVVRQAQKVDVLHIHNVHGYYLNFRELFRKCREMPIVWTWHDMWGATGRCAFSHDCREWVNGCPSCAYKEYYPAAWVDRAAHEYQVKSALYSDLRNLRIVSPSQWLAEIAIERGFSEDQVSVIPNPVDLSSYFPRDVGRLRASLGLDEHEFCALFVAADCSDPRKGYADFEKAIERAGVKGIAVGIPPAKQSSRIHYVGALSSAKDLADWYSAADVMVITSKADNYPNTVIESLACGTPVCGYAVGGVPSQIPDGSDYLVRPGDIVGLAEKLGDLLKRGSISENKRNSLSSEAKNRWNPVNVAKQYLDAYKLVLRAS